MEMTWGVLSKPFPLSKGEEGRFCLNCKETCSSGRSFRAFFFRLLRDVKPRSLSAVGCLLNIQG